MATNEPKLGETSAAEPVRTDGLQMSVGDQLRSGDADVGQQISVCGRLKSDAQRPSADLLVPANTAVPLAEGSVQAHESHELDVPWPNRLASTESLSLEGVIRRTLTEDEEVVPEVVIEIETAFHRALLCLPLDEAPSIARQRKILAKLTPEDFRSGEPIDDAVRVRVGMELKTGIFDLFTKDELPDDSVLGSAIANAYLALPPATAGRPLGTQSLAVRQLARELARIWLDYSGRKPTRSVTIDSAGSDHHEGGAFYRFIEGVMAFAPQGLRKARKGALPKIDHFVRLAQAELDAAVASGSEIEARGFLSEADWLGKPAK